MPILLAATLLAVGFTDVAPVIEKRCVGCHQPGEIAPMAFTSYQEVRPWAKAIRAAVIKKSMPPWSADPAKSVHMANSRALTPKEIDTLVKWVDAGAPEGKPATIHTQPRADQTNTKGATSWTVRTCERL